MPRIFVLVRELHARVPRDLRRPVGCERLTIGTPPPWRCTKISFDEAAPFLSESHDPEIEVQFVAESALSAEQIARYEREAAA